jgi:hypothetical protein
MMLLTGWAGQVAEVVTAEARAVAAVVGHAQKKSTGIRRTGTITVEEECLLDKETKRLVRPFSEAAGVRCRGYSLPLERAVADLGVPTYPLARSLQNSRNTTVFPWLSVPPARSPSVWLADLTEADCLPAESALPHCRPD